MRNIFLLLFISMLFIGCTDARMAKFQSYGGEAKIDCYSGDRLIYSGISTGKVNSSESSDGYYFVDKNDSKLKEVSGNCILTYIEY